MAMMREFQSAMRRNAAPATIAIIALSVIVFLASFISPHSDLTVYIAFLPSLLPVHPWTLLTYPYAADLVGIGFLGVLFGCWWLYGIGGQVERELGTLRFVIFWLVMTVIPALVMWGAMLIAGKEQAL